MRVMLLGMLFVLITGCAISPDKAALEHPNDAYFDAELFSSLDTYRIETEAEIFALSEEAEVFVEQHISPTDNPKKRLQTLIEAIFEHNGLGLVYDNAATMTAMDTFNKGRANCLSMTIMTYSLAQLVGLETQFINVDIPEFWTRREGFSLLNGHVNLRVFVHNPSTTVFNSWMYTTVDFDPQDIRKHFARRAISKQEMMALFYNNHAATALIEQNYAKAFAYLRAAADIYPMLDSTFVNLGVMYRFMEQYEHAEKAYIRALEIEDKNYTAAENLAMLYRKMGRDRKAKKLEQQVQSARRDNPFYHFILGEEARGLGRYDEALVYYRRAHRLNDKSHHILFGMGLAHYQLGNITMAERFIKRAASQSADSLDRNRYRTKLSLMQAATK